MQCARIDKVPAVAPAWTLQNLCDACPVPDTTTPEPVHIACLCAAWCRLCDGYAAVFKPVLAALQLQHPQMVMHWVDIEDEAALVGDLDVETFPTVVVATATAVPFAGTLTPHADTLQRVLRAALAQGAADTRRQAPEIEAFAARLRLRAPGPPHPGVAA